MRNALPRICLALACRLPAPSGPRYEEPETPVPVQFDQATAEATAEPGRLELWAGFGSAELDALIARALEANTTIAQAERAPRGEPRALRHIRLLLVPDRHHGRRPAALAVQRPTTRSRRPAASPATSIAPASTRPGRSTCSARCATSTASQDSRTEAEAAALADAQLSIVAETAQAWFAMIGARERLALQRRAAREPAGERAHPRRPGACRQLERPRPRPGGGRDAQRRRLRAARPRPTWCARSSGSRC